MPTSVTSGLYFRCCTLHTFTSSVSLSRGTSRVVSRGMSTIDHYRTLGVNKDATAEEIKAKYIKLSKVR